MKGIYEVELEAPLTGRLENVVPVSSVVLRLQRAAVRSAVNFLEHVQGPVSTARRAVLALHAASGSRESRATVVEESVSACVY